MNNSNMQYHFFQSILAFIFRKGLMYLHVGECWDITFGAAMLMDTQVV